MNTETRYRDFWIDYNPAPIPNGPNYCYSHKDFDGAPDSGDQRYGWAHTLQEACDAIDEWWFEQTTQD
jgi:hypothetical protein